MADTPEPDWAEQRRDLQRFILHRLQAQHRGGVEDSLLESRVQDALVRLYRWYQRERERGAEIGNLDAMKNRVAGFAAVDLVRDLIRQRRFVPIGPGGDDDEQKGVDPDQLPEPPRPRHPEAGDRLRFLMQSFYERANKPCLEISRHYFADRGWAAVAEELHLNVDTIKQRWSRCVKAFRDFISEHAECEDWVYEEGA